MYPPLPPVDGMFRQVTDMTWDPEGNIYISDGYINSRVAKADKNGNWLDVSFGEPGNGARANSTRLTPSPPIRTAIFTSPTAATGASRCSTRGGKLERMATIDIAYPGITLPEIGKRCRARGRAASTAGGALWAICIMPAQGRFAAISSSRSTPILAASIK